MFWLLLNRQLHDTAFAVNITDFELVRDIFNNPVDSKIQALIADYTDLADYADKIFLMKSFLISVIRQRV